MYVYCWYDPVFNAIKIGIGDDPQSRMSDYADTYGLQGRDLRKVHMPDGLHVRSIEQSIHQHFIERGQHSLPIRSKTGQEATEVFSLKDMTYDAAATLALNLAVELGREIARAAHEHFDRLPPPQVSEPREVLEIRTDPWGSPLTKFGNYRG